MGAASRRGAARPARDVPDRPIGRSRPDRTNLRRDADDADGADAKATSRGSPRDGAAMPEEIVRLDRQITSLLLQRQISDH